MIKAIQTDKAPQAIGPYSQAISVNGFVYCSGQVGVDNQTNTLAPDVATQTDQIMKNLQEVLKAAGSNLDHVVKTTIYLLDVDDFAKVNEVYGQYFKQHKPARATIQAAKLPQGTLPTSPLVEIDAIAVLP